MTSSRSSTSTPAQGANLGTEAAAEESPHRARSITLSTPWVNEVGLDHARTYVKTIVDATADLVHAPTHDAAEEVFRRAMGAAGIVVDDFQVSRMTEQVRVAQGVVGFALDDGTVIYDPHHVTLTNVTPPDRQETDPENSERPTYS